MYIYLDHKLRQEEILREVEQYRLISQAKRQASWSRFSLAPVIYWWGTMLSSWGDVLQERFGDQGFGEEFAVEN